VNKGQSWTIISPDLSTNDPVKRKAGQSGGITPDNTGAETHCSIYSISVSSISEAVIWVGTDDGLVQVTLDGGQNWSNVRPNFQNVPAGMWVSRVQASHFHPGRAYVTFDGHRSDHFEPWVFVTEDFGKTWQQITKGLKSGEVIRSIVEDHKNPDLLFIGSETGVWMTLNRGQMWTRMAGLPTVSVYDLKIHSRENDLIVATHGRGIWVMDDISPLQELAPSIRTKRVHLFTQKETTLWENVSRGGQRGHFWWAGGNPKYIVNTSSLPRAEFECTAPISFYVGDSSVDSVLLTITDPNENLSFSHQVKVQQGINRYYWNREFDARAFTAEENIEVQALFKEITAHDNSTATKNLYQRFLKATTPLQKRKIMEQLSTTSLSPIPERYGMLRAKEGFYKVQLRHQDNVEEGALIIQKDPLSK
jgi:Sortilin, neurotensin receptor 3,